MKRVILAVLALSATAAGQGTTTAPVTTTSPPVIGTTPTPPVPSTTPTPEVEHDSKCKVAVVARNANIKGADGHWCDVLGVAVVDRIAHAPKPPPPPPPGNINQPTITDTPGAQISAGQTAAVASGQPVGSAGGSLAAVGATGQGLELVTALAINPGTLAIGDTDKRSAYASRFADVSVVLPANLDPADGLKKGFSYIGVRARINVAAALAWQNGRIEELQKKAVEKYTVLQADLTSTLPLIKALLAAAPEPGACADAIEARDETKQLISCGSSLPSTNVATSAADARAALGEFRAQVDHHYLSVEGRFDRGDLNADGSGHKDWLLAGYVAYGHRFSPTADGGEVTIRLRGGVSVFEDGAMGQTHSAFYGAGGIELAIVRDLKRYVFSVGAEVYSKEVDDNPMLAFDQRDNIRFGVGLPLADGKSVSVGLTVPVNHGEPILALSGDWSLLLESLK